MVVYFQSDCYLCVFILKSFVFFQNLKMSKKKMSDNFEESLTSVKLKGAKFLIYKCKICQPEHSYVFIH